MENFKKEEVVPDVLKEIPKGKLTVQWDGRDLEPGALWTPTQVQNPPKVSWRVEEGALYTLVMADPDSPSRANPITRESLHWLITNIPGSDIDKGDLLVEYVGSGAPKGTGLHRYCIFVFKQPGKIQVDMQKVDKYTASLRVNFSTQKFSEKHNLGPAIAGNLFLAEYDDYVPTLHAQFKR